MTATVTEPYDAMLAGDARGVYARAKNIPWTGEPARAIGDAVLDLAVALKHHRELRCGIVPAWIPGITAGPDGLAKCLRMAAERAWEAAGEVTRLIGEHCGDKAAEYVSGEEGGKS